MHKYCSDFHSNLHLHIIFFTRRIAKWLFRNMRIIYDVLYIVCEIILPLVIFDRWLPGIILSFTSPLVRVEGE